MSATLAQPADQLAGSSPEQADCLCKLKDQPEPIKEPDDKHKSRIQSETLSKRALGYYCVLLEFKSEKNIGCKPRVS
jgi:hypothetical protein